MKDVLSPIAGLIIMIISSYAIGGLPRPSYKDARAIYDEIVKPIDETGGWYKKPLQARTSALRESDLLIKRVEKTFGESMVGDGSACRSAAISRRFYISALNDMVLLLEGRQLSSPHDLLAPMFISVGFGENKADCLRYIDTLDTRR